MLLSETQQVTLWITSMITGGLSLLGSSFLVYTTTFRWRRHKFSSPRDRILLGMSLLDIVGSICWMLGPVASPAGEIVTMYHAYGTQATCAAQGFGFTLGAAVGIYNAMLAVYYTFTIVFMIGDVTIRIYLEWFLHLLPLGFAVGSAVAGLMLDMYNSNSKYCWMEPYPRGCTVVSGMKCTRGENAADFQMIVLGYPTIAAFVVELLSMAVICIFYFRLNEGFSITRRRNSCSEGQYSSEFSSPRVLSVVYVQAMLYVLSFLVTYTFGFFVLGFRKHGIPVKFWLMVCNRFLLPFQGFLNALIFIRPTYLRLRERKMGEAKKCGWQTLLLSMRRESIDFTPPSRARSSSMLQAALRKSISRTIKRNSVSQDYSSTFSLVDQESCNNKVNSLEFSLPTGENDNSRPPSGNNDSFVLDGSDAESYSEYDSCEIIEFVQRLQDQNMDFDSDGNDHDSYSEFIHNSMDDDSSEVINC